MSAKGKAASKRQDGGPIAKSAESSKQAGITSEPSTLNEPLDSLAQLSPDAVQDMQQTYGNSFLQRLASDQVNGGQAPAAEAGTPVNADVEQDIDASRGGGGPLPDAFRERMEGHFDADFSQTKVHTDDKSDQLSRSLGARSFTTGSDIFFKRGEYDPNSQEGQKLLAHELTHVVQQGGNQSGKAQAKLNVNEPGDRFEQEADAAAEAAVATPEAAQGDRSNGPREAEPAASGAPAVGDGGMTVPSLAGLATELGDEENEVVKQAGKEATAQAVQSVGPVAQPAGGSVEAAMAGEQQPESEAGTAQGAEKGVAGAGQEEDGAKAAEEETKENEAQEGEKEGENKKKGDDQQAQPQKGAAPKIKKHDIGQVESMKFDQEQIEEPEPAARLPSWNELAYGTIQLNADTVATEVEAHNKITGAAAPQADTPAPEAAPESAAESATAAEPQPQDINRSQLIADAFGAGIFQGASEGGSEFVADGIMEAGFTHGPGKNIPYADGLLAIAQIAMDPEGWAKNTEKAFSAEAAGEAFGAFGDIGKETTWAGKIAATLEATLGIIDWFNNMLGVIQSLLQILLFILASVAAALAASGFAASVVAVLLKIIAFIEKILNFIMAISNFLLAIKPTLQLLAMTFRTIDIHIYEGDPRELMDKQAKLTNTVSGFTKSATQRGLNKASDKMESSYATRKQQQKAAEIADNDATYTRPKGGKSRDELKDEYRARYGSDPEVDIKVKREGKDALTSNDKLKQAEATQYQAQEKLADLDKDKFSQSLDKTDAIKAKEKADVEVQKAQAEFNLQDRDQGSIAQATSPVNAQIATTDTRIGEVETAAKHSKESADYTKGSIDTKTGEIELTGREMAANSDAISSKSREIDAADVEVTRAREAIQYYDSAMRTSDEGRLQSLQQGKRNAELELRQAETRKQQLKDDKAGLETQQQELAMRKQREEDDKRRLTQLYIERVEQSNRLEQEKTVLDREKVELEQTVARIEGAERSTQEAELARAQERLAELEAGDQPSGYDKFWEEHKKLDMVLTTALGSPTAQARGIAAARKGPASLAEMKAGWSGQRHGSGPTGQSPGLIGMVAGAIAGEEYNPFSKLGTAARETFVSADKEEWGSRYNVRSFIVKTNLPDSQAEGQEWQYEGTKIDELAEDDHPVTLKLTPSQTLRDAKYGSNAVIEGKGFGEYAIPVYKGTYAIGPGVTEINMTLNGTPVTFTYESAELIDPNQDRPIIEVKYERTPKAVAPMATAGGAVQAQRQVDDEVAVGLPPAAVAPPATEQAAPPPAPPPIAAQAQPAAESVPEEALLDIADQLSGQEMPVEAGVAGDFDEDEGGGALGAAQARLTGIRQAKTAEMIEVLPEPPNSAIERVNAAAAGYEIVAAQEEVAQARQQEIEGFSEDADSQELELGAASEVGAANMTALGAHQADIDEKLASQDAMAKSSEQADSAAKEGAGSSNPIEKISGVIMKPIMEIFGGVASKFTDQDTSAGKKSVKEAEKSAGAAKKATDIGQTGAQMGAAQASQRKSQTLAAQSQAKASEKEMAMFTDTMATRRDAAQEGREGLDDMSAQNQENLETFQSDQEGLLAEHEGGQDEAEMWADEHFTLREMMFGELEAELAQAAEEEASNEATA